METDMSELIQKLTGAAKDHKGTDLGGLLQWAALHIEGQDKALKDLLEQQRIDDAQSARTIASIHRAQQAIWDAWNASVDATPAEIEFARDYSGHMNRSFAEGDPDYTRGRKPGKAANHKDLR